MPSEGDQIRIAVSNSSLGGIRFKTSRRDDLSREILSRSRGRNGPFDISITCA
jgi:hypothetical protein